MKPIAITLTDKKGSVAFKVVESGGIPAKIDGVGGGVPHAIKCYQPDDDDPDAVVEVASFVYPAVFDDGSGQWIADTEASPVTSAAVGAYLAPSAGKSAYMFDQLDDAATSTPLPCSGGAFVMPDINVCVLDQR